MKEEALAPLTSPHQVSLFTLSYLGDACYELWSREAVLQTTSQPGRVHSQVTERVRCQTQARLGEALQPWLTPEEQELYRRGKNTKPLSRPRHALVKDYRAATAFECLVGYWYLSQQMERFETLMHTPAIQEVLTGTGEGSQ